MQSFTRRAALVALLLLLASTAPTFVGAQQEGTFEPQPGQPGKDVVWVPTPLYLVDTMLDMAKVTPADYVVDLGSGDGVTVIAAARRGVRAHGIEYDKRMVDLARQKAEEAGVARLATFEQGDVFEKDFSKATVVTMFLLPSLNLRLRPTLLEMKPGTRVVANTFDMADWEPDEKINLDPCERWCTALLWIVPAKVGGRWRLADDDLSLTQTFQTITGTLGSTPLANARLRGDEIHFDAGRTQYVGRVNGKRMGGTYTDDARQGAWIATRR